MLVPLRLLTLLVCSLLCLPVVAQGEWVLAKDSQEVKVWKKTTPASSIKSFKATTTVKSSLSALMTLFYDLEAAPQWIDRCSRVVALRRNDDLREYVLLMETDIPWPVSDRDAVIVGRWWQDPKTLALNLRGEGAVPGLYPENPSFVRSKAVRSYWTFRPVGNGMVEVSTEGYADPSGNLPPWVVNIVIQESPYNTLVNIRNIIRKDKYQKAVFPGVVELQK